MGRTPPWGLWGGVNTSNRVLTEGARPKAEGQRKDRRGERTSHRETQGAGRDQAVSQLRPKGQRTLAGGFAHGSQSKKRKGKSKEKDETYLKPHGEWLGPGPREKEGGGVERKGGNTSKKQFGHGSLSGPKKGPQKTPGEKQTNPKIVLKKGKSKHEIPHTGKIRSVVGKKHGGSMTGGQGDLVQKHGKKTKMVHSPQQGLNRRNPSKKNLPGESKNPKKAQALGGQQPLKKKEQSRNGF